jgi:hypothetical protein
MQPNEAFKIGFLARCVEEGLSPTQTGELVKQAAEQFEKQSLPNLLSTGTTAVNGLKNSLVGLGKASVPLLSMAAAAPPTLGAATAYLANRAVDVDDDAAVEDLRKQELIDTYRRMSEQLERQQRQISGRKQKRKQGGRIHL